MNQFDRVLGVFEPKRTDDLQNDAAQHIGKLYTWRAMWVIEDGPYEGEWAMGVDRMRVDRFSPEIKFAWVPESDIRIVGAVEREKKA